MYAKASRQEQAVGSYVAGVFSLFFLTILIPAQCVAASPTWSPTRNVEIVVAVSAGGGTDGMARAILRIWQQEKVVDATATVVNKPGGAGAIGMNYINQHKGDAHYLIIVSPNFISNYITNRSFPKPSDFTPIARLAHEYVMVAVNSDLQIRTAKELTDRLRENPASLSVGIAAARGNFNHMAIALAVKATGGDIEKTRVVVFNSSGGSITALLGGHVDVVVASAANLLPHLRSGKIRVIAVAASQRLGGAFAEVPTFSEQGINVVVNNWRAVLGPGGMAPNQIDYWESVFDRLVRTKAWEQEVERISLVSAFLKSDLTRAYFDAQTDEFRSILVDLGLVK